MANGDLRAVFRTADGRVAVLIGEQELRHLHERADAPGGSVVLTAREKEALRGIGGRLSTAEVARAMGVALGTAVAHLASARRKYGVRTSIQAAECARKSSDLD